jgi:hypothetical protein
LAMGKRIERMRSTLRRYFRMAGDPIPYDAKSGYCCQFKVGCSRSFEK